MGSLVLDLVILGDMAGVGSLELGCAPWSPEAVAWGGVTACSSSCSSIKTVLEESLEKVCSVRNPILKGSPLLKLYQAKPFEGSA